MQRFIEVILTCASQQEAQAIVDELMRLHLIACAELLDVQSNYRWQGEVETAGEVKLIMQTRADYFAKIETIVKNLHSYETPALHALPIVAITKQAAAWLEEVTDGEA